jgi:hypothetical protein
VNPRRLGRGLGRRDDLDLARLELGAQRAQLLLVEVVLVGERLECLFVDCPPLLRLLDEAEDGYVKIQGAQVYSLPSCLSGGWAADSTPSACSPQRPSTAPQ